MMEFESFLLEQLKKHPSMQAQDIVKLCYQAAYGAEHLLSDMDAARACFMQEFGSTPPGEGEVFESISPDFVRVNIGPWKHQGLPANWLFELFRLSAAPSEQGRDSLAEKLRAAEKVLPHSGVSKSGWQEYVEDYVNRGMPPVHHSGEYREAENPAYRLVRRPLLRLLPVLERLEAWQGRPCVIAIDGRAGSGKSTLAEALGQMLDADIVHMDDFFLPLELRSPERLSAPGGNVHYERFREEVLPKLRSSKAFCYNVFSCSKMQLDGVRTVRAGDYRIVEGSYSLHPEFGDYADVAVFSHVESEEQLRRVKARDGEGAAEMFAARWIPMEEKYFAAFDIAEKCSVIV